jgi:hypothetical protein
MDKNEWLIWKKRVNYGYIHNLPGLVPVGFGLIDLILDWFE